MEKIYKEIGEILKKNKDRNQQWLKRQLKKLNLRHNSDISKEEIAIAVVLTHRDWTEEQIAKEAGVNRGSLYRFKKYRRLREELKKIAERDAKKSTGIFAS